MFTRHKAEFAEVNSTLAVKGAMVNLDLDTMLESTEGWKRVAELAAGEAVATLDGGFAPISWIGRAQPTDPIINPWLGRLPATAMTDPWRTTAPSWRRPCGSVPGKAPAKRPR